MRERKAKSSPHQARADLLTSHVDIDWHLHSTQNGVEDAEAILVRRVQRTGQEVEVTDLGRAWAEACYSVELLFELLSAGDLKPGQAARFNQFLQRIQRILPILRKHQLLEPRINWSEI